MPRICPTLASPTLTRSTLVRIKRSKGREEEAEEHEEEAAQKEGEEGEDGEADEAQEVKGEEEARIPRRRSGKYTSKQGGPAHDTAKRLVEKEEDAAHSGPASFTVWRPLCVVPSVLLMFFFWDVFFASPASPSPLPGQMVSFLLFASVKGRSRAPATQADAARKRTLRHRKLAHWLWDRGPEPGKVEGQEGWERRAWKSGRHKGGSPEEWEGPNPEKWGVPQRWKEQRRMEPRRFGPER